MDVKGEITPEVQIHVLQTLVEDLKALLETQGKELEAERARADAAEKALTEVKKAATDYLFYMLNEDHHRDRLSRVEIQGEALDETIRVGQRTYRNHLIYCLRQNGVEIKPTGDGSWIITDNAPNASK